MIRPPPLDPKRLRDDFPVLRREEAGRPLVYLDSAATSQVPTQVLEAMESYDRCSRANVHRGDYQLALEATAAYEEARDKLARFVGAEREAVVFTKNCTEAINLVAYAWARRRLRPGDEIVTTLMEHHSNLVPWQLVARDTGASLRYLPLDEQGDVELRALTDTMSPRTRLVCISGMSNVLGGVTSLGPLVEAARAVGALVLCDAAQLAAHAPLEPVTRRCDFVAISGHKVLGPTGIGALIARPALLAEMDPFLGGGEMILDVTLEGATWNELPYKFEAGTPPIAQAIGLGAAIDYWQSLGEAARAHEARLTARGLDVLGRVPGLRLYGRHDARGRAPIFSFNLQDGRSGIVHPHDIGTLLAEEGIAIRAGHHCAKPLHRYHLGVVASCRASLCFYNTEEELERLAGALDRARQLFLRER